jgi:hypothetical protein
MNYSKGRTNDPHEVENLSSTELKSFSILYVHFDGRLCQSSSIAVLNTNGIREATVTLAACARTTDRTSKSTLLSSVKQPNVQSNLDRSQPTRKTYHSMILLPSMYLYDVREFDENGFVKNIFKDNLEQDKIKPDRIGLISNDPSESERSDG